MNQCIEKAKALPSNYQAGVFLGEDLKSLLGIENCPVIQSAADIHFAFERMAYLEREVMIAGTVDCKCRLVFWNLISVGTSDRLAVRIGEAFTGAIRCQASAIFLVHNHPSGSLEPSKADLQTTETVAKAGLTLGYPLLDHVIISNAGFKSIMTVQTLTGLRRRREAIPIIQCAESQTERLKWTCENCKVANVAFTDFLTLQEKSEVCTLATCSRCKAEVWLHR